MEKTFIIRSTERNAPNCYFSAINGFSAMFLDVAKARKFPSSEEAIAYATAELFTSDKAFYVEAV